jgi:hypothetical protein
MKSLKKYLVLGSMPMVAMFTFTRTIGWTVILCFVVGFLGLFLQLSYLLGLEHER